MTERSAVSVAQFHCWAQLAILPRELKITENMVRETIAQRIMQCTPRELQKALDVIHSWKDNFNGERVETVQDIIDLLSSPEYIKEAEDFKNFTGQDYLRVMFGI